MYTTLQGDTWDQISKRVYGSEFFAKQLIDSNIDYISTIVFPANIKLNTPIIRVPNKISKLPPWRY